MYNTIDPAVNHVPKNLAHCLLLPHDSPLKACNALLCSVLQAPRALNRVEIKLLLHLKKCNMFYRLESPLCCD